MLPKLHLKPLIKDDMMFTIGKLLLKVIITVQLFNWTLMEVDQILPGTEEYARSALQQIEIPSHDEIIAMLSDDGEISFASIGSKIDRYVAENLDEEKVVQFKQKISNNESIDDLKQMLIDEFGIQDAHAENWEEL